MRLLSFCILLVILLMLGLVIPVRAQQPQVEAILFYMEDCPNCEQVIQKDVPAWQAAYRGRPIQPTPEQPKYSGMTLAWIVWIGMFLALAFTIWVLWRAFAGVVIKEPEWLRLAVPILSLLGLGVALYLTYIETTTAQAICGPVGDCNAVQNSPYALLFGVLPVGLLGAGGYVAILAAWLAGRYGAGVYREYAPLTILGMGLFGILFSVYLTYLEIFVIHAVCIWCLTSALLITLVMLVSLPQGSRWLSGAEEA